LSPIRIGVKEVRRHQDANPKIRHALSRPHINNQRYNSGTDGVVAEAQERLPGPGTGLIADLKDASLSCVVQFCQRDEAVSLAAPVLSQLEPEPVPYACGKNVRAMFEGGSEWLGWVMPSPQADA
jgi:hypothetical protein